MTHQGDGLHREAGERARDIRVAAMAIMEARIRYGWTFGKRPKVMAIDEEMAKAALDAVADCALRDAAASGEVGA